MVIFAPKYQIMKTIACATGRDCYNWEHWKSCMFRVLQCICVECVYKYYCIFLSDCVHTQHLFLFFFHSSFYFVQYEIFLDDLTLRKTTEPGCQNLNYKVSAINKVIFFFQSDSMPVLVAYIFWMCLLRVLSICSVSDRTWKIYCIIQ